MKYLSKKNGFTLVELLGVIAILAVLISISIPVYNSVKKVTLEKQYENIVITLKTAAEKYCKDTGVMTVNVQTLINEGYVTPDDQEYLFNPIDKSKLNCYILTIKSDNGNYIAELKDNLVDESGSCGIYEKNSNISICADFGNGCNKILNDTWFNEKSFKLQVKFLNNIIPENVSYEWRSTVGDTSNDSTINVLTDLIKNVTYSVQVTYKVNGKTVVGNVSQNIKVDLQKPIIDINVKDENIWTISKEINLIGTDGIGSGIKGFYFLDKNEVTCPTDATKYNNTKTFNITKNGSYKYCTMDKVGNVSDILTKKISKIDSSPTVPIITASDNILSGSLHNNSFRLNFSSTTEGSPIIYYYGTSPNNINNKGNNIFIEKGIYNVIYYVKACSENNFCSTYSTYRVNPDNISPKILNISNNPNSFTSGDVTINANLTDNESGLSGYAITRNSSKPSSWNNISGKTYNLTYNVSTNGSYYIWAKDKSGNVNSTYTYINLIDKEGPKLFDFYISSSHCDSYSFSVNFAFYWSDNLSGINPNFQFNIYPSASEPSYWYNNGDYIDGLECGTRYYYWVKVSDNVGNITIARGSSFVCNDCAWDGGDPTYPPSSSSESYCSSGTKGYQSYLQGYWCFQGYDARYTSTGKCPSGYHGPHDDVYCCANGMDYNDGSFSGMSGYACLKSMGRPKCSSGTLSEDNDRCN